MDIGRRHERSSRRLVAAVGAIASAARGTLGDVLRERRHASVGRNPELAIESLHQRFIRRKHGRVSGMRRWRGSRAEYHQRRIARGWLHGEPTFRNGATTLPRASRRKLGAAHGGTLREESFESAALAVAPLFELRGVGDVEAVEERAVIEIDDFAMIPTRRRGRHFECVDAERRVARHDHFRGRRADGLPA